MSVTLLNLAPHADQKAAAEALERRQRADYECYLVIQRYRAELFAALRLTTAHGLSASACNEIISEIQDALDARVKANEEFLASLAGYDSVEL